jgi:hypothetical protein
LLTVKGVIGVDNAHQWIDEVHLFTGGRFYFDEYTRLGIKSPSLRGVPLFGGTIFWLSKDCFPGLRHRVARRAPGQALKKARNDILNQPEMSIKDKKR